ncbi:hypothetical protein ABPG75_009612 [Micractinium tetrahymenae]
MAPAPALERACAAFAACFFAGADEAVLQYVQQSIVTAAEDGAGPEEQAESLQDFLPPGGSAAALAAGLSELDHVLRHPIDEHSFAWLQSRVEATQQAGASQALQGGSGGGGGGAAAAAASLAAAGAPPPLAAGAAGEQQPTAVERAMRSSSNSSLRVGAAEFRPGGPAASLATRLDSLQISNSATHSRASAGSWSDGLASSLEGDGGQGAASEGGSWPVWASETAASGSPPLPRSAGHWAAAAAAAEAQAAAGGGLAAGAFLAVLADQFPLWSAEALQQLFEEQGGDLAATISTLCSLESELEGQQQAGSAGSADGGRTAGGAGGSSQASFTEEDFPSLGGFPLAGSGSAAGGRGLAGTPSAGYASAAAAAADLPVERRQRSTFARPPRRVVGSAAPLPVVEPQPRAGAAAAAASPSPAPIWQQEEGVARFATGQALAAQYAGLRADARDHARLRNAYFQQATQAYMAGNRRLAKELGAKGRWHNEQMHAAHAAAAAQLFAQRNAGGAAGGAAGSGAGGRSSGVRTVDLHGLHVREALDRVDALLAELAATAGTAGSRRLRLVVGEGRHASGAARLPACVKRYLDAEGVAYSEPYAGLLELRL